MAADTYEVVCPDGLVRHTPYAEPDDAEAYVRFANRGGNGEPVKGAPCEPNLTISPVCRTPSPGQNQAHWVRVVKTQEPLLEVCPMCEARPSMPAAPTYDMRGPTASGKMLRVAVDVPCPSCPASLTYFVETGHICCFTPNQQLKVRTRRGP